jgi:hypothetical protein
MTFTTDVDLNPTGFSTSGAPLIFVSGSNSSWEFNNGNKDNLLLINVSPVSSFNIVNFDDINLTMTINFYHPGLNNYAHKGGDYVVTLVKQ